MNVFTMKNIPGRLWVWDLALLTIFLLILSSCAPGTQETALATEPATKMPENTPTEEPTPTSIPTDTPSPTNTPAPTATPEPTSTPAPDLEATAAFEATQQAELAIEAITAELEKIGYQPDGGYVGWVQENTEMVYNDSYNTYVYLPFAEDFVAKNFVIKTDITWASTSGLAGCGFFFRSEPNIEEGEQYEFVALRLSGLPIWQIMYADQGEYQKDITGPVTASAIDQGQNSTNTYHLIAEDGKFTVFINNQRIGTYYDYANTRSEGYFAYETFQESGETTCYFDNTWIWVLE